MKRGRSTGNMTKAEAAWVDATKRNGCLCCIEMGYPHEEGGSVVEADHLLSGGIRIGHFWTVGSCLWHHKSRLIVAGWTHDTHRRLLGPSKGEGGGSVPFHTRFGTDNQLLAKQILLNESKGLKVVHPDRDRILALAANDSAEEAKAA